MNHVMNLWPDSFEKIKAGTKTVEMRLNDEKRQAIAVGDTVEFVSTAGGDRLLCRVTALHHYRDFGELYAHHDKVSIGYGEQEKADPADMLVYYAREKIERYGALGIELALCE